MSFDVQAVQKDLKAANLDGWLFYDFRGRDPIAQRILKLPEAMRTRRWFYFLPAQGTPGKLVHKIEAQALESLPGETFYYAGLQELEKGLKKILGRAKNIAMQYSPKNAIPYISMVDAGTIEMVRAAGAGCICRICVPDSGWPPLLFIASCRLSKDGAGGGGADLATTARCCTAAGG